MSNKLGQLAELIVARNAIDQEIASMIGRPALPGHVGEYIASQVFGIALHTSAAYKGSDGHFMAGALAQRTVNIKCYAQCEGLLDLVMGAIPDYYLVLTGPRSAASSSRGGHLPWMIDNVFLFDASALHDTISRRGVKLGVATSVPRQFWNEAEVYPEQRNQRLIVSDHQRMLLAAFGSVVLQNNAEDPHT